MRRILIYILIAIAVLAVPVERTDVADLRPVQTVALYKVENGYRIETDTKDSGTGATVDAAFAQLMDTTPGVIYLDTADFFLVFQGAQPGVDAMRKYLKSTVKICAAVGEGDLQLVSKFLSVRGGLQSLRGWKNGQDLPVLDCRSDRIKFM